MKATAQDHPVTAGLRSSLHVFGGYAVKASAATSLAELESGTQGAKGSAIVENRFGKGRAILLAPDLIFSIVHIQQGMPVFQDAKPAPDGSAPFNDGALKAEGGFVLDWQRDRDQSPSTLNPRIAIDGVCTASSLKLRRWTYGRGQSANRMSVLRRNDGWQNNFRPMSLRAEVVGQNEK